MRLLVDWFRVKKSNNHPSGITLIPRFDFCSSSHSTKSLPRLLAATALTVLSGAALRAQSNHAAPYPFTTLAGGAAVTAALSLGTYTVQVSGVAGVTGTILVEIYELP